MCWSSSHELGAHANPAAAAGAGAAGDVLISWLVLRDSHHEIEEVYDAQLAQSARLLQGVLRSQEPGNADWERLYQAFDQAMSRVGVDGAAHPMKPA